MRSILEQLGQRFPELRSIEATGAPLEVALARQDPPDVSECRLLEDAPVRAIVVETSANPVVDAFLDGVQDSRVAAYLGTIPLVRGLVSAVVRERIDGRLVTWRDDAPRQEAFYAPWSRLSQKHVALFQEFGVRTRDVRFEEDLEHAHPLAIVQRAANAVKEDRETLEAELASRFLGRDDGVLYLDGSLPPRPDILQSRRVVGVIKSHNTLYARGADLTVILGLAEGTRSSAFAVEHRRRPPVASWYLRLRDNRGRDPFWGLVRLEVPLDVFLEGGPELADARSAWVLAERTPLALPDGRWDTMAYGIRNCEEFLKATLGA
jgi:hypothetical protein